MVYGKNKRKIELRANITYDCAKQNKIVAQVVYEWFKNTKACQKTKFNLLRNWKDGTIMLLIDLKNLKVKPKKPEYSHFLNKYLNKYLGVL